MDVHRQGATLQLLLGRGTEYPWQLWIPPKKGWRENGRLAAGLRDCWSWPSRTGWGGINLSANKNRLKCDNRKWFEFFQISQPCEHLELLFFELISDVSVTTWPFLFTFKILPPFDLWMRLPHIPPNSAWMQKLLTTGTSKFNVSQL